MEILRNVDALTLVGQQASLPTPNYSGNHGGNQENPQRQRKPKPRHHQTNNPQQPLPSDREASGRGTNTLRRERVPPALPRYKTLNLLLQHLPVRPNHITITAHGTKLSLPKTSINTAMAPRFLSGFRTNVGELTHAAFRNKADIVVTIETFVNNTYVTTCERISDCTHWVKRDRKARQRGSLALCHREGL
ncbi:hypothetical protein E2C01_019708 [Portunus trituberculatus]|uniref:Uncharacterized protein n=1 Tax=Portunus trituberculatus TaxID=210409 RepID=A0A5B7E043_PORTR|nr:hypothetical protein [Portunus trituberculatus]